MIIAISDVVVFPLEAILDKAEIRRKETKKCKYPATYCQTVAPHAGAWIETVSNCLLSSSGYVAPHAGAWIETSSVAAKSIVMPCRPPCGGVD